MGSPYASLRTSVAGACVTNVTPVQQAVQRLQIEAAGLTVSSGGDVFAPGTP